MNQLNTIHTTEDIINQHTTDHGNIKSLDFTGAVLAIAENNERKEAARQQRINELKTDPHYQRLEEQLAVVKLQLDQQELTVRSLKRNAQEARDNCDKQVKDYLNTLALQHGIQQYLTSKNNPTLSKKKLQAIDREEAMKVINIYNKEVMPPATTLQNSIMPTKILNEYNREAARANDLVRLYNSKKTQLNALV